MDLGLRDRVCVVTGSTGGIGLETARLLAAEGARVVVTGRGSERVERARRVGEALHVVRRPRRSRASRSALVAEAAASAASTCLVNNVGYAVPARLRGASPTSSGTRCGS